MRTITFLDGSGDTTISWAEDVDTDMKAAIRRLMEKGYTFFIIDTVHDGKVELKQRVHHLDQLTKRSVVVSDAALSEMFHNGRIAVASAPANDVSTVRVAQDADEVIGNRTVATRRAYGG